MSKLGKEGHKRHFRKVFKSLNDKIVNSASSPSLNKEEKNVRTRFLVQKPFFERIALERETSF